MDDPHSRAAAEERSASMPPGRGSLVKELLHELQVQQIELEMQNKALRQAQVDLEASRDRFARFYELAPFGYLALDDQGLIADLNPTAASLLGQEQKQLQQQPFARFVMPEYLERWYTHRANALGQDKKQHCELELLRGDGFRLHVRLESLRLLKADHSTVLRSVMIDITEQKEAAAEAALRAKRAFLANMSHEFRTPLHTIAGVAHLLKRSGITPTQAEWIKRLDTASQHLLGLFDAVLTLASLEAGGLILQQKQVDISSLVEDVAASLKTSAQAKGIDLQHACPPLPERLLGDPEQLRRALLNYVANAIKFIASGNVVLRALVVEEATDSVLLRFEVADTGPGIAPEDAERLFCAFEQADNSMARQYAGCGLELVITKKLARLMGGNAGVDIPLEGGSVFWFTARLRRLASADF